MFGGAMLGCIIFVGCVVSCVIISWKIGGM